MFLVQKTMFTKVIVIDFYVTCSPFYYFVYNLFIKKNKQIKKAAFEYSIVIFWLGSLPLIPNAAAIEEKNQFAFITSLPNTQSKPLE